MSTFSKPHDFVMDAFGLRQFNNPTYTGTQINFDPIEFEKKVNQHFVEGLPLVEGYAPFCKHLFVPNFCGVKCGYAKIDDSNRHLIRFFQSHFNQYLIILNLSLSIFRSGYEARKENELAVLIQWFDKLEVPPPEATFLDIILYR